MLRYYIKMPYIDMYKQDCVLERTNIPFCCIKMYSMLFLLCSVIVVCPVSVVASSGYPCPVDIQENHTSYCECNLLSEIFCYNLDSIPLFIRDEHEYSGLYMDNQDIREVLHTIFFDLKVRKISLNSNPIEDRISVNALSGLESELEELHLADCQIKSLPDKLLVALSRLSVLHLWGNQIEKIPDGFFRGTNQLYELALWDNAITELNENSFSGLWNLNKLDLDHNRISRLDKEMFRHLGKLEVLYMGANNVNAIDSDTFQYMNNLKILKLDNNGLAFTYDYSFRGLRHLKVLQLQNNLLDYLQDKLFSEMRNLSILFLQNNILEFMWAKNFENLRNLQELHLSYNKLTLLNDHLLQTCSELAHLYVDHNQISTLKKCSLPRRTRLKTLSLVGNPVECDCRLSWIQDLHKKGVSVRGSCKHSPAGTPIAISDKMSYGLAFCKSRPEDCPRQ